MHKGVTKRIQATRCTERAIEVRKTERSREKRFMSKLKL